MTLGAKMRGRPLRIVELSGSLAARQAKSPPPICSCAVNKFATTQEHVMKQHIIHFAVPGIAAAVDDLRDTLAAVAGPQLVTRCANPRSCDRRRQVHWQ